MATERITNPIREFGHREISDRVGRLITPTHFEAFGKRTPIRIPSDIREPRLQMNQIEATWIGLAGEALQTMETVFSNSQEIRRAIETGKDDKIRLPSFARITEDGAIELTLNHFYDEAGSPSPAKVVEYLFRKADQRNSLEIYRNGGQVKRRKEYLDEFLDDMYHAVEQQRAEMPEYMEGSDEDRTLEVRFDDNYSVSIGWAPDNITYSISLVPLFDSDME